MKNSNTHSHPDREWREPYFTPAPPRMLEVPATGSLEISDRYPPHVKYAGTFWRFKICGSPPGTLTHRQRVTIIGRQGNCLLIQI